MASAYQKRQAASAKRATKSRRRRIENAERRNTDRVRRIKQRNVHRCEDHDRPMLSTAGMQFEVADRNTATCYGGIGLAHAVARQSGLAAAIDRHVELLRSHFPYHESDHVLNIAFNALADGTCLEDLKKKRTDEAYLNALGAKRIPDASTAGDFCRRFESKADIDCLHTAIDEARRNVWSQQPDDFFDCATVDMDGSIVETTGECKFGMDMSYKGIWGYHPLLISLAETREPLRIVNRSGNQTSEDAHAQERSLLDQVLPTVRLKDLWIADRNFCTLGFLFGIVARKGRLIIRHHANMPLKMIGRRRLVGQSETGKVYEQKAQITDPKTGRLQTIRCVTVKLHVATRDGEQELRILTNLSIKAATALKVADLYRKRWSVETMFQEMTENLTCEIRTLGYPRAAVFAFCLALMAWNGMSVIHAALRNVHGEETVEDNLSGYYLALEISQVYHGMMIAIPPAEWEIFQNLTTLQLAALLKQLARKVSLKKLQKNTRGPKRRQPKRKYSGNGQHVATAKLLARRNE